MIDLNKITNVKLLIEFDNNTIQERELTSDEIRMIYEIIEPDATNISDLFRTLMVYDILNGLSKEDQFEINKWCKQFEAAVDFNETKINYVNEKFESLKINSNPKIYIKKLLNKEIDQYNEWKSKKNIDK